MNFIFDKKTNDFLMLILENARIKPIRVFFVGGIVRDNILNVATSDIDLLVLGDAIDFVSSLPSEIKVKSIHKDFCTAKVIYDDLIVDIASTRSESYPYSGCLPVVDKIGVDILSDAQRRDFSVNALYCELKLINGNISYELIDPLNGLSAIKDKKLRVLHNKSYIDDPTRILRGVDFKHRFGFEFSDDDNKLINEYLSCVNIEMASQSRIHSVFRKILYNFESFREIVDKKYYKILFNSDLEINFDSVLNAGKVFDLVQDDFRDFYLKILENESVETQNLNSPLEIYKFFSGFLKSELAYYFYKTNDPNALKYLDFKDVKLKTSGEDLINAGYQKGKLFSVIFDNLLNEKLLNNDKFLSKEDEILWVKNNYPL